jgi:hypothetical protein
MRHIAEHYEKLKIKFNEKRKILNHNKEHFIQIRNNNFNLKKLICDMIKIKTDKV